MSKNNWFYALLEKGRNAYETDNNTIPSRMNNSLKERIKLLKESEESLKRRSPTQKSIRSRARNILWDIFEVLGPEVLLLCFPAPVVKLANLQLEGLLKYLESWWSAVFHPQSLTEAANAMCKNNSLERRARSSPPSLSPRREERSRLTPAGGALLEIPTLSIHEWPQTLGVHYNIMRPGTGVFPSSLGEPYSPTPQLSSNLGVFTKDIGGSHAWALPLTVEGAEVIVDSVKKGLEGLQITLPTENGLPFIMIPHQLCADILRKYNK